MFIGVGIIAAVGMLMSSKGIYLKLWNCTALVLLAVTGGWTIRQTLSQGTYGDRSGLLYWDALSALLLSVIIIIAVYVILFSLGYMEKEVLEKKLLRKSLKWYYFWIWIFIATMLIVVSTPNLGIIWVGIEMTTIATTLIVGFYRNKQAVEAAWKYVVLCTVGISFALLGTMLLFAAAAPLLNLSLSALDWRLLPQVANQLDQNFLRLGVIFAVVGYGAKVGLVPMHAWLPDAHSQAPSPVSALLSAVLLNCALYAILRWYTLARLTSLGSDFMGTILMSFGLLSLAVMVGFILLQKDIKRLLAYSSVEHMGILALGFGLGTREAVWGASLHLFLHGLTKANLFVIIGNLVQKTGTRQIPRIRGILKVYPYTGIIMVLGLLAITGTPPFGTFRSELSILSGLYKTGHPILGFLAILCLTIVFAGFLFHFLQMLFGKPRGHYHPGESISTLALAIPLLVVLFLGLFIPHSLNETLNQVVKVILGGV
ncbi:proton-conducting transporter membrane subunit [Desulfosporosinus meridiei]|uniref:Formate hydrogenlyase subunit 3/multisubunit Na+/H+ antiporter, MnhD subunit n=1 Tax=Desulfosporosinus meridiei (strain ATCC BAA-275 / DSM 13257 / KCTC 12902 / NCIMB 13706 / S10) TaxID=768704 RepID=J7IVM6_DESMD|nr:proton-conducting transporter membrane subunit [Desulfosporosinus meridiei]AFQ43183.1 formate hydrogenlyase subunit 3/multisubunit Na+/H+ antiporter, MnhD subunit [Desulfosporosinus meridiei DSM 13257]